MVWNEGVARQLGAHIRSLRNGKGLSQEELGSRAGVTKNQIQLIEAGRQSGRDNGRPSNPRMSTLVGIAEGLGVSLSELVAIERPTSADDKPSRGLEASGEPCSTCVDDSPSHNIQSE